MRLLEGIRQQRTHEELATIHQRSKGAIQSKLRNIAVDYHLNNRLSIDQVMKLTGLSTETISQAITKRQGFVKTNTALAAEKDLLAVMKDIQTTLHEIRDIMQEKQKKV